MLFSTIGLCFRNRYVWIEFSTIGYFSFFFFLEKSSARRRIRALRSAEGSILHGSFRLAYTCTNRVAKDLYGTQGPAVRQSNFYRSKVRFRSWVCVPICGPCMPSPSFANVPVSHSVQSVLLSRRFSLNNLTFSPNNFILSPSRTRNLLVFSRTIFKIQNSINIKENQTFFWKRSSPDIIISLKKEADFACFRRIIKKKRKLKKSNG